MNNVGRVISEYPFVKLLTEPKLEVYELVPGLVRERWECLAQVNSCLAWIEVKVYEDPKGREK